MHGDDQVDLAQNLKHSFGWALGLGILLIALGVAAIAWPLAAGVVVVIAFGWMLLFAGVSQAAFAFYTRGAGQYVLKLVLGLVYAIAGLSLIFQPLMGLATLTFVLGIAILAQSVFQVVLAFSVKPDPSWIWLLIAGVIGLLVGALILFRWPFDAPWLIGLLVGINLIGDGLCLAMFSAAARGVLGRLTSRGPRGDVIDHDPAR